MHERRKQRQEEQHRLRVQRIGDEAHAQAFQHRDRLAVFRRHLDIPHLEARFAERLDAEIDQIGDARPFDDSKQHQRFGHDQAKAEDGVADMKQQGEAHAEPGHDGGASPMHDALAQDNGKIGARHDDEDRKDGHQAEKFENILHAVFRPVVLAAAAHIEDRAGYIGSRR